METLLTIAGTDTLRLSLCPKEDALLYFLYCIGKSQVGPGTGPKSVRAWISVEIRLDPKFDAE